jgi:hypothetical protein
MEINIVIAEYYKKEREMLAKGLGREFLLNGQKEGIGRGQIPMENPPPPKRARKPEPPSVIWALFKVWPD